MSIGPEIQRLHASVFHGRKGKIDNRFTYRADYVLCPIGEKAPRPVSGLAFNKLGLWALHDRDFGTGCKSLHAHTQHLIKVCNIPSFAHHSVSLLTMPSLLGYSFNPISFWLFLDERQQLRACVAEVTNVGRDRHSYLCKIDDFVPIKPANKIVTSKRLHVSPFQNLDGEYTFQFDLNASYFNAKIKYVSPTEDGMTASLSGALSPLSTRDLFISAVRYPFGALRVMALIHWQALKLKIKGAEFRSRPLPPEQELSQ